MPRTGANARVPLAAAAMSAPGATNITCGPRAPSGSSRSLPSTAPTPTTPGHDAGYSGGAAGPSLPTAATISMPCATARSTIRCSTWLAGPTRLMLTTATCMRAIHASSRAIASTEPPVGASQ